MSTDTSLISFKVISSFINDIADAFGDDQHSINLYKHLLSKTTLSHETAINKHLDIFKEFCIANREAFTSKDAEKLTIGVIEYSDKVKVDLAAVFKIADAQTSNIIWKHLLTISAVVDPAGQARKILSEMTDKSNTGDSNFLTDIINKIEDTVDPDADPMTAISSIMSSGVFTELISGMGAGIQDGSLDMGQLMGSVQGMMGGGGGEQPPLDIAKMMGMMMGGGGAAAMPPDISKMMITPDLRTNEMVESIQLVDDSDDADTPVISKNE